MDDDNFGFVIFFMIALGLFLIALGTSRETSDDFSNLKRPIVVVGIKKETRLESGSVILRDSLGHTWTASTTDYNAAAICNSYNLGDTLK